MNCKQGDIARIVAPYRDLPRVGWIVEVIRPAAEGEEMFSRGGEHCSCRGPGGVGWVVDASGPQFPCYIGDAYLRPLRDPGDDAQDETLAWKPVPVTEQVSA